MRWCRILALLLAFSLVLCWPLEASPQPLLAAPGGTASVAGQAKTTTPESKGSIYYVRDWCNIPNHLDDSCFTNAISDVVGRGVAGFAGHKYAELIVSPEVYVFTRTVTLPAGVNLGIHGSMESGVYGSTIETGLRSIGVPGSVDDFLVLSDSVNITHLSFLQTSDIKRQAIILGSKSVGVFDSHINWCWFAGSSIAIHAVNTSGLDLSHNTFDGGTEYGIVADASRGDVNATAIIASDLRGFANISSVRLVGDGSSRFSDVVISGIFDRSVGDEATIDLTGLFSLRVQGTFTENNHFDVSMSHVTGATIGPFTSRGNRFESIRIDASHNVAVSDGTILDVGRGPSDTLSAIDVTASTGTTVHNVTSRSMQQQATSKVRHGISIDAASSGSTVYGNSFAEYSASEDRILDRSAVFPVQSLQIMGSLKNGTGFQHKRSTVGCVTSAEALATCSSALLKWEMPFSDNSYTATCTMEATTGTPVVLSIVKHPEGFILTIINLRPGAATGTADCLAIHD